MAGLRGVIHDLPLLRRAAAAPLLMLASLLLLATALWLGASWTGRTLQTIVDDRVVPLHDLRRIDVLAFEARLHVPPAGELLTPAELDRTFARVDVLWRKYLATWLTPEEATLAAEAGAALEQARAAVLAWRDPADASARDAALAALSGFQARLEPLVALQQDVSLQYVAEGMSRKRSGLGIVIGLLVLAGVAAMSSIRLTYLTLRRNAYLLERDESTGLANRRGMLRQLQREPAGHGETCLGLWFHFDSTLGLAALFGSGAVDSVIATLADRVRNALGTRAVVGRPEHGVLAVFLRGVDDGPGVLRQLEGLMAQPVDVHGNSVPMSWYCGVEEFRGEDLEQCFEHPRIALVRAWQTRQRGFVTYSEDMNEAVGRSVDIAFDVAGAVEEGRVEVLLQPQVELPGRRVVAAEALMRLRTATGRLLLPAEFLPFCEESGLIVPLGECLRERVLRDIADWRAAGLDLPVSLNLSARELGVTGMAERLLARMAELDVPVSSVRVEIPEAAFAQPDTRLLANLELFHRAGLHVAVDDFGTGASVLGRLAEASAQRLKIDRSLVARVDEPGVAQRVAVLCCDIGRAVGVPTLAEGVETEAQCRALELLGVKHAQGWLFGRPLPPGKFLEQHGRVRRAATRAA